MVLLLRADDQEEGEAMFKVINPRTRKIRKSAASKAVLDALNKFLDDKDGEPIRWLTRMWKGEQKAITYKQLRIIVKDDPAAEQVFSKWFQDYSKFVKDMMTPSWKDAFLNGWKYQPKLKNLKITVDSSDRLVRQWITEHGAQLVTNSTETQVDAIRYLVAEGKAKMMSSAEIARYIRPTIGLTRPDAAANLKLYNTAKEQLKKDHPRMTDASIEQKARDIAVKDAQKRQSRRAETIARTELAYAYNEGNDQIVRQCISDGTMPNQKKIWSTSGSGNVCSMCEDLEGTEVDMDGKFSGKIGKKTYEVEIPPIHPRCACAVLYEDTGEEVEF